MFCRWHDHIYRKPYRLHLKKKNSKPIKKFNNIAENKISIQKLVGFLYTGNELSKKEKF
jgi:hypothetical protein